MRATHFVTSVLLVACGAEDREGPTPDGATSVGGIAAPAPADGIQLRHTYPDLPPGEEVHYCQLYVLPDHPVDVQRFEHSYTEGGHHVILYPTALTPADVDRLPGVFDCDAELPSRGESGFGYVGGAPEGDSEYPPGVVYHFEPRSVVLVESHMLNLGSEPLDVDYRVNLLYATVPVTDHVGTIFMYDNHIRVPAHGSSTVTMSCGVPRDIQVLGLVPHMHVRGTEMNVWLDRPSGREHLTTEHHWATIEPVVYQPAMPVTTGDRFGFDCRYDNPDDRDILEGSSKDQNEMCLLIGSYYPRIDFPFEFCIGEGSGPVLTGTRTCGETFQCFATAEDPFATDACALDTCAASSQPFNDFFNCAARECFFPGRCEAGECQGCVLERCQAEVSACMAATCE